MNIIFLLEPDLVCLCALATGGLYESHNIHLGGGVPSVLMIMEL